MKASLPLPICALALAAAALQISAADAVSNKPSAKPAKPAASIRKVDIEEFEKLMQDKRNVVLDVRTKKEFDAGHIPGARNIDIHSPDFEKEISTLDKDKVYLVHCGAGVRSARACVKMKDVGFMHLIDLAPGFKAWEKAGKKIEK